MAGSLNSITSGTIAHCAASETVVSNTSLTLRAILAPDPDALAWAMAVRARFPDARPLYGTSSVGTIGRQP